MNYIEIYLLPVPLEKYDDYKKTAQTFGDAVVKYGGLRYREFKADDAENEEANITQQVATKPGEMLTSAIAEFNSKEHRDEVMKAVLEDETVKLMMNAPALTDMKRMIYGGFTQLVEGNNA